MIFRELGGECKSSQMPLKACCVDMRLPSLGPRTEEQSSRRCGAEMGRWERRAGDTVGAGEDIRYGRLELGVGV